MQIELIATASEDSAFLPRLGLGVLASLTPAEDEVIYTDVMQNRLVKYKIVGGSQRFRSASNFDPMATALGALAVAGESATEPAPEKLVKGRSLRVIGA